VIVQSTGSSLEDAKPDAFCAFTIELRHKDELHGYLNIYMNKKYLNDKSELDLLKELAGDISYALSNLRLEASLKKNEQELIISNDKFEKAFNNTPNIIIISNFETGKIYDINKTFTNIIGYEKDEVIGKTTFEIDLWHDVNDRQKYIDSFKKLGYVHGDIYTFNSKNKEIITAKVYSSLVTIDNKNYILAVSEDISESIKTQAALNESEKKFRLLIEQSPFVIEIYDMNGLQIEVNHAYEILWEFPAKTTLNIFNILKSQEVEKTGLLKYVEKAYKGEYVNVPIYEFDSTGKTEAKGKGRVRSLSTKIFPLKDKNNKVKNIVIMHEDVTDQEETRKLLQKKKEELETVIQEAPNPIMIHNEDGEVLFINKIWEQLTGYKYEEINTIEKWIKKAYGKQMPLVKEDISKLYDINAKVDHGEYNIFTKDKKTITWQYSSASLGLMNGKRTVISSAMDITELKNKDNLIMMQSRHAAMGEMIGMIAHQWRQPISIIAMAANNILLDIALESFDTTKAEKFSQNILEQTSHLSKTIDDFRNFFKSDKEISKVKLRHIIEETLNIVKNSLVNNSIELQTSFKSESEVDAYPRELMQVFINIINNAKDAIVSNEIEKPVIKIKVYDDEKYVNTEICDNAQGIDADVLLKIFEPYFTTKDEKVGTGLGLYMSKIIVENHLKGIIEAFNKEDGACFRVRLLK
jgi:PAS domain S-box-containing protein